MNTANGRNDDATRKAETRLPASHPSDRSHTGGWRTAVLVGAVAVAAFSFGNFWTREMHKDGMGGGSAETPKDQKPTVTGDHGASMKAAPAPHGSKPLWTCSMHPQVIMDHPGICPICHMELTPLQASTSGDKVVMIDPTIVQNMGVRTALVTKGALVQTIHTVGYLDEPEPLHKDINLRVSGWIEKLYANSDGMKIEKGQPLFDLYSPELTVAADEFISAQKQLKLEPADATNKSLVETSRRKLLQLGLMDSQIDDLAKLDAAPRTIAILAPSGGHLTAKMVYEGSAVKAGDLVMRIASRHEMWIDAQVYEQQIGLIAEGQTVNATVLSEPGKVLTGKVLFVHPHLDPQTRTALVRIAVPNEDHALRENMYATVEILVDDKKDAIVVPREAVIDSGRRQVAFVAFGGGRFEPRDLKLGASGQDGTVEVLEGLKPGETVVTSGQFLIDSESRLKEALAKHLMASQPSELPKPEIPMSSTDMTGMPTTGPAMPKVK